MFKRVCLFLLALNSLNFASEKRAKEKEFEANTNKVINKIVLTRKNANNFLTDEAILNKIPFKENCPLDIRKTSQAIHNLYKINSPYGFFEQIYIMQENLDDSKANLHIITYEKPQLEEIVILGNENIPDEDLEDKLDLVDIQSINEVDLQRIEKSIRKAYLEKSFHNVKVNHEIYKKGNKTSVVITIEEGEKSMVKRVYFKGNKHIKSKELREIILTKEDWILAFLNKAGIFMEENIEIDKYLIENYYKTKGFMFAKATDVKAEMDPVTKQYTVTYTVSEGDCYTVSDIKVQGNDILSESAVLKDLPIKKGEIYSEKDFRDSIEKIRKIWGIWGYIFADVEPLVIPDTKKKTVSITFNSEIGEPVKVNRINIIGNNKTQDKVIRRRLSITEGDLLTSTAMEASKVRVENLGYFDTKEGVNWKINRIDETTADLDLMLKEVKTGKFNVNFGFGGNEFNPLSAARSLKFGGSLSDINFLGSGIMVRGSGSWSRQEWSMALNVANPWFLEKPILAEADIHFTKAEYSEELRNVSAFEEKLAGGFVGFGKTISKTMFKDTAATLRVGGELISHTNRPRVETAETGAATLQKIINQTLQDGTFAYLSFGLAKDYRNHNLHPSSGYQWALNTNFGVSEKNHKAVDDGLNGLGFAKVDFDASWYTPLIKNFLIFGIHGHAGIIGAIQDKDIPYRELYHVGGPTSVRGFLYGQIGPTFLGDSIGAKKAFWVNTEIVFPITQDFSMKGVLFYDGGAGWDNPFSDKTTLTSSGECKPFIPVDQQKLLKNNNFNFRHAFGFGFRMIYPQPFRIDVGFKLDKQKGEKALEVHFSANREF